MSARSIYKGYIIQHTSTMSRLPVYRVLRGKGPKYFYESEYKDYCEAWINNRIELRAARKELEQTEVSR